MKSWFCVCAVFFLAVSLTVPAQTHPRADGDRAVDLTHPTLSLDPGNGEELDNSHPLLIIQYADHVGADTTALPSGLNAASLRVTLDGTDVTKHFYTFKTGAVATFPNLKAGAHQWDVRLTDFAGISTHSSVRFSATGTTNTAAPLMSDLNLVDEVTEMPDVASVWVQGKVHDSHATVQAWVNGGEGIPMNRRGDVFGYQVPLEPCMNVIVLVATDTTGHNRSSKVLRVTRGNRYRAVITSPAFGSFANGQPQVVKGYVSAMKDANTPNAARLMSVSINGIPTVLGPTNQDGTVSFTTSQPVPVNPGGRPTSLNAQIVWDDPDVKN